MNEYTAKHLNSLKPEEALEVLQGLPEKERQRLMKDLNSLNRRFAVRVQLPVGDRQFTAPEAGETECG